MLFIYLFIFHILQIRAQANVLKKAVVEEQTRNSELRDVLKEREQSLRKAEQEMDSLTFRNQQLTKRVTVLQDELDLMQASDLEIHFKKVIIFPVSCYCHLDFNLWTVKNTNL